MRLALVTETFPPEINGVAMTLSRLAAGLAARGHHVDVLRPRPRAAPSNGAAFHEIPFPGLGMPFYPEVRIGLPAPGALAARWTAQRPDLVHVATEGPLGLSAARGARRLGIPLLTSFHTNFHQYTRHYGIGFLNSAVARYLRSVHNLGAVCLAPDPALVDHLRALGFRNPALWGRGVDTTLFHPAKRDESLRAAWGAVPGAPVLIHVSRLAPEKNLPLVLDTFRAVRAAVPAARLVVVGDGPLRAGLQRRCPHAVFAGWRTGEDLARHYASADIFPFASATETFGNVILEGLASGLVVASFDYAAARQQIRHNRNGLLVPPFDAATFTQTVACAAANPASWPPLRHAARATAEAIPWSGVLDAYESAADNVRHAVPLPARPEPVPRAACAARGAR